MASPPDQALKGKMGDNSDALTLVMKTNTEKATPEEAAQMLSLQRDYLAPCRKIALESAARSTRPSWRSWLKATLGRRQTLPTSSPTKSARVNRDGEPCLANQRRAELLAAGENIQRSLSRSP